MYNSFFLKISHFEHQQDVKKKAVHTNGAGCVSTEQPLVLRVLKR